MEEQDRYEIITAANLQKVLEEDEEKEALIDEILEDHALFTRIALFYADRHKAILPHVSFLEFAVSFLRRERGEES